MVREIQSANPDMTAQLWKNEHGRFTPTTYREFYRSTQELAAGLLSLGVAHGDPVGAQQGSHLEQMVHDLEVRCLPGDMIDILVVDVSGIELDVTMLVNELPLPEGIEVTADPDLAVFQVRMASIDAADDEEESLGEEGDEEGLREVADMFLTAYMKIGNANLLDRYVEVCQELKMTEDEINEKLVSTGDECHYVDLTVNLYSKADAKEKLLDIAKRTMDIYLESGDSLLFRAKISHRWKNIGNNVANILIVLSGYTELEDTTKSHFSR